MPKSDKREYRAMKPLAAEKRAEEQEQSFIVTGYAATFNEPYVLFYDFDGNPIYEQIDRHAFDDADMSDVIMQFDHCGMVFARTRNESLKLWIDDHGLPIRGNLGLTAEARQLYEAILVGNVCDMSFCFTVIEDAWNAETRTSTILKIGKVYDVSAVSIPANPGTDISVERRKALDGVIERERAERLAAVERQKRIAIVRLKAKIAAERK